MSAPGPTGTLRERKRSEARLRTVDAALELFARDGFAAVTVDEICAAAGIAPRTFFRYFPAKEDVLFAPLDALAEEALRLVADAPAGDGAAILAGIFRRLAERSVAEGGRVLQASRIVAGSDALRLSPGALLTARERALAEALHDRGAGEDGPPWRTRLVVARAVAVFRLWLEAARSSDPDDPLALYDAIAADA